MNKLYLLLIGTLLSCHNDFVFNQNRPITEIENRSPTECLRHHLDSIQWNRSYKIRQQDQISESVFYKAEFDYYSCTFLEASIPKIEVYYERNNLYFYTENMCLLVPHSLEFFDIDDYYVFIESPDYIVGSFKTYSILKIPLKSNLECISEVSIILSYDHFCLQVGASQL